MDAKAINATLGVSPIPNQTINKSVTARVGMVRLICTMGSTATSPGRESPATSASTPPNVTPIASPTTTSKKDMNRFEISSPEVTRSNNVPATADGAASVCSGMMPVRDPNSQKSSNKMRERARERAKDRRADRTVVAKDDMATSIHLGCAMPPPLFLLFQSSYLQAL